MAGALKCFPNFLYVEGFGVRRRLGPLMCDSLPPSRSASASPLPWLLATLSLVFTYRRQLGKKVAGFLNPRRWRGIPGVGFQTVDA